MVNLTIVLQIFLYNNSKIIKVVNKFNYELIYAYISRCCRKERELNKFSFTEIQNQSVKLTPRIDVTYFLIHFSINKSKDPHSPMKIIVSTYILP